ncbi:Hypothetical predicted protein [Mytilus galloprovincialis]|uniref:Uncharacterized protein n=1 Tax=Mytilus galloprovincialis TaxID=29158 RepID=A0A8B6EH14_MYTGA|nr:Hypothetical predicted protein [Mytilus galloprovincialis]
MESLMWRSKGVLVRRKNIDITNSIDNGIQTSKDAMYASILETPTSKISDIGRQLSQSYSINMDIICTQTKQSDKDEVKYRHEKDFNFSTPLKSFVTLSETYDDSVRDKSILKHPDYKVDRKFTPKRYQEPHFSRRPSYELYDDRDRLNKNQGSDYPPNKRYVDKDTFSEDYQSLNRYSTDKYPSYDLNRHEGVKHTSSLDNLPKPVTLHEKRIVRREKEPQSFDGKTIDWQDYLVHFEQVAEWNEWNDLERAKQIVMSLRGPAQKILSTLSKQDLGNYK